jgi:hypothetical protein
MTKRNDIEKQLFNIVVFALYGFIMTLHYIFGDSFGVFLFGMAGIGLAILYAILELQWVGLDYKFRKLDEKVAYEFGYEAGKRAMYRRWQQAYNNQKRRK